MEKIKKIDGGVCAAKGFKASGLYCGIKDNPTKKNDICLVVSDKMCNAAAVYTQNKVKGAPILVTKSNLLSIWRDCWITHPQWGCLCGDGRCQERQNKR